MKTSIFSVIVIAIFALSCDNAVFHDSTAAINIANQYLKKDLAGHHKEAYELFDDAFKNKVTFEDHVKGGINNDPNLGVLKKAEFKYFMVVGAQAYLELIYNCDFEKIQNVPIHIILSGSKAKGYKITVLDIGYNYKTFGEDESKRPQFKVDAKYIVKS